MTLVGVGAVVAVGCVTAGVLAATDSPVVPAQPWAVQGSVVVADLSVVRCPTSYGIARARDVDLPARVKTQVSRALAGGVSVFTDGLGTVQVVAPSRWGCTALDSVSGSSRLVVYPPGSPRPTWGGVTTIAQGIEASQTGSCGGCSLEEACPLFAAARHAYVATYRVACARASSPGERRTASAPWTVRFVDPPGVLGAGQPSGGGLAAYGVMLWRLPGARHPTAWLDTCTLPVEDRQLCVLSVFAFLARHPAA